MKGRRGLPINHLKLDSEGKGPSGLGDSDLKKLGGES